MNHNRNMLLLVDVRYGKTTVLSIFEDKIYIIIDNLRMNYLKI